MRTSVAPTLRIVKPLECPVTAVLTDCVPSLVPHVQGFILACYHPRIMTLTRRDLDLIRQVVRSELERLGHDVGPLRPSEQDDDEHEDPEIAREAQQLIDKMRRTARERAARPMPQGALDRYDAARLAGVSMDTVGSWVRRGLLPGRKVKGRLEVDRAELEQFLATRRTR